MRQKETGMAALGMIGACHLQWNIQGQAQSGYGLASGHPSPPDSLNLAPAIQSIEQTLAYHKQKVSYSTFLPRNRL
jgi:hypothetical protein